MPDLSSTAFAVNPTLYKNAGYDPIGAATFATPGLSGWFKSGKLKPIVVMSAQRAPSNPEVPTAAQAGFRGYTDSTWQGFFAPAGTPRDVVVRINQSMVKSMASPPVSETLAKIGFEWAPNTSGQFAEYVKTEVSRWSKVVRETGARAD